MFNKVDPKTKAVEGITKWKVLEPFLSDYRIRLHGRQLASMINMSHVTVAWTLKRLEEGNILKSEQEGRNKKYYLNLDNFHTKDHIERAESMRTTILSEKYYIFKKMREELILLFREIPLVLFGSYAKDSQSKESDIDILIMDNGNVKKVASTLKEFGEKHNKKIQVQKMVQKAFEDGLRERDTLVMEIVKDHVILNNIPVIVDILWRYYNDVR